MVVVEKLNAKVKKLMHSLCPKDRANNSKFVQFFVDWFRLGFLYMSNMILNILMSYLTNFEF